MTDARGRPADPAERRDDRGLLGGAAQGIAVIVLVAVALAVAAFVIASVALLVV